MHPGEELRYLILAVQREGNRQLTEALRPLKLTPSQAEVIQVLQQYQPMTLMQLGERLVCETGSPSRLVKSMVEAGWVKKETSPADARAVLLSLTPTAETLLPQLNAIEQAFNEAAAAQIDEAALPWILEHLRAAAAQSENGRALQRRKTHT